MKVFSPELIKLNYYALDKKSCLSEMVDFLYENGVISNSKIFLGTILERELLMSTGIGRQIAIPHGRSKVVRELKIAIYLLDNELEFESIDSEPVRIVFMIAVPDNMKEQYMKLLSSISNYFRQEANRDELLKCETKEQVYRLLKRIEDEI
jgi:fructose-specific phosphotransferase system IIA component